MHHVQFNNRLRPHIGLTNAYRSDAWLLEAFEIYKTDIRNIRCRGGRVLSLVYQVVQHQGSSLFTMVGTVPHPSQQVNNVPASQHVPGQLDPAAQLSPPNSGSSSGSNNLPAQQVILTLPGARVGDGSMFDEELRGLVGHDLLDTIEAAGKSDVEGWSARAKEYQIRVG